MNVIIPDWPAPANVVAFTSTRTEGYSHGPWRSLNLGMHAGDVPTVVSSNREKLGQRLPASPQWLRQVHGTRVMEHPGKVRDELVADALVAHSADLVCAVLTADCLPVLFCDRSGAHVGIAHAGWRGLAGGVLEATVGAMEKEPDHIMAWLGPAIGPTAYEVGSDVKQAFGTEASRCFTQHGDRWMLDLYEAARLRLALLGVTAVYGGNFCTFSDHERFFSYRRDGVTGRMASVIWMQA